MRKFSISLTQAAQPLYEIYQRDVKICDENAKICHLVAGGSSSVARTHISAKKARRFSQTRQSFLNHGMSS